MPGDPVAWLEAVFADLGIRAPHGIGWSVDRAEVPLRLRVALADGPVTEVVLRDDGPLALIAVVEQVQGHIDAGWDVALPPCPDHAAGLVPVRAGNEVRWRCPHGDADCAVGDYDDLLWPPHPEDHDRTGMLLGARWHRRGIRGVARWSVTGKVVQATVHEGTDEAAVRAAAAPLDMELEWIPPVGWARRDGPDGDTLTITNAAMHLARLAGPLHRSPSGGLQVADTAVRLLFEHRIGAPGGPLLLDAGGVPFADEGDQVVCGGGFTSGPVQDTPGVFLAGQITRAPQVSPSRRDLREGEDLRPGDNTP